MMDPGSPVQRGLHALCVAILSPEGGGTNPPPEVFQDIQREVEPLRDLVGAPARWTAAAERQVVEWLAVPDHWHACLDLNYGGFTPAALLLPGDDRSYPLHLYHILEAFSRTGPVRYAGVWLPLLDLAEAAAGASGTLDAADGAVLQRARQHLQAQRDAGPRPEGAAPPPLDALMNSLLGSVPGLQDMLQQIVGATSGDPRAEDMQGVLSQIQGLLNPLLSQAAASASATDPTLSPAIGQILSGFNALTQALVAGPLGPRPTPALVGVGGPTDATAATEAPQTGGGGDMHE